MYNCAICDESAKANQCDTVWYASQRKSKHGNYYDDKKNETIMSK